jgi:ubiquinone biosynthesis protein
LSKYGFGIVLLELFPEEKRPDFMRTDPEIQTEDVYRRIKLAIEELGPTYVKLGQILSVRRDIFPAPLIQELQTLTDRVKTVPYEDVQGVINEACGEEDEFCISVDHEPFAGASMSQVHRAKMKDGTDVVFKVQRPNIRELIEVDLIILEKIAERVESYHPYLRPYNPVGIIEEFSKQIRKELDFIMDGKNAETVALNMKDIPEIKIPKIYWEHSGPRLLVMEYVDGVRIDDIDALKEKHDVKKLAAIGYEAYLKQVFIDGFFHGDPHPGNLLVTDEGQIAFLDFGMVGILRPERRTSYTKFFYAIISNDTDMLIETLDELGVKINPDDIENFKDEMYVIYKQTENYEMDQFSFGETLNTLTSILQRYKIVMPGTFMLMIKVITMIGDVGSQLDPEFDIIGNTKPYLNKLLFSSMFNVEDLGDARQAVTKEILEFPNAFRQFLSNLSSGRSRMEVTAPEFKILNDGLEHLTQKMVYSILAVGLMISVALIAPTVSSFSKWQGLLLQGSLIGLVLTLLKLWRQKPKK